jgi:hypothetical protein
MVSAANPDLPTGEIEIEVLEMEVFNKSEHWRPSGPLLFGLEYRIIKTEYDASSYSNRHLNLAFGFEF